MEVIKEVLMVIGIIAVFFWMLKILFKFAGVVEKEQKKQDNIYSGTGSFKNKRKKYINGKRGNMSDIGDDYDAYFDYLFDEQNKNFNFYERHKRDNLTKHLLLYGSTKDLITLAIIVGGFELLKKILEEANDS